MAEARVYLHCPYTEKEQVKALGARFDPDRKSWWCPASMSLQFGRWIAGSAKRGNALVLSGDQMDTADVQRMIEAAGKDPKQKKLSWGKMSGDLSSSARKRVADATDMFFSASAAAAEERDQETKIMVEEAGRDPKQKRIKFWGPKDGVLVAVAAAAREPPARKQSAALSVAAAAGGEGETGKDLYADDTLDWDLVIDSCSATARVMADNGAK